MEHVFLFCLVGLVLALSFDVFTIFMQVFLFGEVAFGHLNSKGTRGSTLSCRLSACVIVSYCV